MNKKLFLAVIMMMVMVLALCACGEKKEQTQSSKVVDNVSDNTVEENEDETFEMRPATQAEIDKLVIELDGGSLKIRERFEDVKGRMGAETKPSQSYTPCGGSDDEKVTCHYYDGMEVEETHEGVIYNVVISGYDYPDSKATVAGIKLGDTAETVKKIMGVEPDTDSEYTINYIFGDITVSFGLDFEGTGNVNYISVFDISSGIL